MKPILSLLLAAFTVFFSSSCVPDYGGPGGPGFGYVDVPSNYRTAPGFTETNALESELEHMHQAFNNTSQRVEKVQTTLKTGRKAAEAAVFMINRIRSVENQIVRLERELKSLSKIPQLRMLKPVAKGVASLKTNVNKIRVKAEKLRDQRIKPAIRKMKSMESKLGALNSRLELAAAETAATRRHLRMLKSFVIRQGSPQNQVDFLEALSKTLRYPVTPAKRALAEFDSACADVEAQVNQFTSLMRGLTKLSPGLDKVKKKMEPIDEKVTAIGKVLSKSMTFKNPFGKKGKKEVTISIRNVLEAPGAVLDIAVKPLMKLADKLLSPITKKLKFDMKAPEELRKISAQLDAIAKNPFSLNGPSAKFDKPANIQAIENFRLAMKRFKATTTAKLPPAPKPVAQPKPLPVPTPKPAPVKKPTPVNPVMFMGS
ncbi:MAG: hypothetical protein HRT61_21350 [Ekhidna sp.]|nr:hypothetical protein [Ekhidna sp.]